MKVLEFMSFNPEWFLTLPGILITGGVVLLLIALAILLTSNKKEESMDESYNEPITNNTLNNSIGGMTNDVNNDVNSINNEFNNSLNAGFNNSLGSNGTNNTGFVNNVNTQQPETLQQGVTEQFNQTSSTLEINSMPSAEPQTNPVSQQPISFDSGVKNEGSPVIDLTPSVETMQNVQTPIPASPIANQEISAALEVSQPQPQAQSNAYGGVSPTASFAQPTAQPKPVIYGGADPLENTAPIPKIETPTLYNQPVSNQSTQVNPTPMMSQTTPVNSMINNVPNQSIVQPSINDEIETL